MDLFYILRSMKYRFLNDEMKGFSISAQVKLDRNSESDVNNYCRATGDDIEKYNLKDGELPPFYFSRYIYDSMKKVLMNRNLRLNFFKMVHAWQNVEFKNMDRVLDIDNVKISIHDIYESGAGQNLELMTSCYSGDEIVIESLSGFIIRSGDKKNRQMKKARKSQENIDALDVFEIGTFKGQESLYAETSGDRNLIHTSTLAAKLAGFRGKILHGMCGMTVLFNGIMNKYLNNDWKRVKSFSCRFSNPVYPGEKLTVSQLKMDDECSYKMNFIVKNKRGRKVYDAVEFSFRN